MGKTDGNLERRAYRGAVSLLLGVVALNVVSFPNCSSVVSHWDVQGMKNIIYIAYCLLQMIQVQVGSTYDGSGDPNDKLSRTTCQSITRYL